MLDRGFFFRKVMRACFVFVLVVSVASNVFGMVGAIDRLEAAFVREAPADEIDQLYLDAQLTWQSTAVVWRLTADRWISLRQRYEAFSADRASRAATAPAATAPAAAGAAAAEAAAAEAAARE